MFRLIKYEMRKNITSVVILFAVIMGLEGYFLISALTDSRSHTAISSSLLVIATMVAYFCVCIFGIATYSKELKSKTGYMTFMTPISSFSIIGSKLISTLIEGVFFAILLVVLACTDMALFEAVFPETKLFSSFINMLLESMGVDASGFWLGMLATVIELLVTFFAIVSMAYLAITLSSTAFQNKKYKGVVSAVIFIVIVIIVSKVADVLPNIYSNPTSVIEAIVSMVPALIYFTVITVASIFVSGTLLEKKVSL